MPESVNQKVAHIFQDSIVWDAHAGVFPDPRVDLNLLDEWQQNNFNYLSINVGFDVMDWQKTLSTLAAYRAWILARPDRFTLAASIDDIESAKAGNRLAVSFDIEGMNALNDDINMLGIYHALGVRQMLFAYNLSNTAAGGCHDRNQGLSQFGREIVAEMNRLGMIVDCSHAAHQTTMDIIQTSTRPVVFSHSNPDQVWAHPRNIKDDQIKACADTNGVIGINGMGIFLGDNVDGNSTILRHINYLSDLVGTDHIGLGFDYSPDVGIDVGDILQGRPDFWPPGNLYDTRGIKHAGPPQCEKLCLLLQKHGYGDDQIRGIFGENFKRVASESWGTF
ncbi:MAG: membrane dipeptidase [Gammaproteobacteria bacterium]|jgi:membrane dipeptidase